MSQKIKNFEIHELVPKSVYDKQGEAAWDNFKPDALTGLSWVREQLGTCVINNWYTGGAFSQSGLRTIEFFEGEVAKKFPKLNAFKRLELAKSQYESSRSQHKIGNAFDCKFKKYTAEQARQFIKGNWEKSGLPFAITLEEKVNWVHIDFRSRPDNKVYSFIP